MFDTHLALARSEARDRVTPCSECGRPWEGNVSCEGAPQEQTPAQRFLAQVARMTTDAEMDGNMSGDDACSTLSALIEEARTLTQT